MNWIPILICFVLFLLKVPVAISLIFATVVYFAFFDGMMPMVLVIQRMVNANQSFTLLAVPFFVTLGVILNYAGISEKLLGFCNLLMGHKKGGLGYVNILLTLLMSGVSGAASADAAMGSKVVVPQMVKHGYDKAFSTAVTAASALISPIIPPGVGLIIFASMTGTSVGRMFLGGYVPGLLMGLAFMAVVYILAKHNPDDYRPSREHRASFKEIFRGFLDCFWALIIPPMIIVGLRFGFFTPTEAGAIIIALCLFAGFFVYKKLKISHIPKILVESATSSASIMLLIVGANLLGFYMSWERIPQNITAFITGVTQNPLVFLLIVNLFLIFMGMFLEGTALLMIATPLLFPAAMDMGIDPVHFGFVMITNIAIGGITPPFGSIMFLTCAITKVSVVDFMKKGWPFVVALLVVVLTLTYFPTLVTFLPNLIMG